MNAVVQVSSGRTSAYMLHLLLEQHGGLPKDWLLCFENTGKEREESLVFLAELQSRWQAPIHMLEFDDHFDPAEYLLPDGTWRKRKQRSGVRYREVTFETASRKGEPFIKLLKMLAEYRRVTKDMAPVLPNVVQRLCTAYLKRKTCRTFLLDQGWDDWDIYMGIRKDEEGRKHKMLEWLPKNETLQTPLIDLKVTKQDVMRFWDAQPFDLQLDRNSDEGNCDLCFLKKVGKLVKIIQKRPESVQWWKDVETLTGATFSRTKPTFHQIDEMVKTNDPRLAKYIRLAEEVPEQFDCFCGGE